MFVGPLFFGLKRQEVRRETGEFYTEFTEGTNYTEKKHHDLSACVAGVECRQLQSGRRELAFVRNWEMNRGGERKRRRAASLIRNRLQVMEKVGKCFVVTFPLVFRENSLSGRALCLSDEPARELISY